MDVRDKNVIVTRPAFPNRAFYSVKAPNRNWSSHVAHATYLNAKRTPDPLVRLFQI